MDFPNLTKLNVFRNLKFHFDCIWGVADLSGQSDSTAHYGFSTYSSDGMVRFWDSDHLRSTISGDQAPILFSTLIADAAAAPKHKFNPSKFG